MGYIYKITNDINDKIYIGKTNFEIEKRFSEHKRESQKNTVEKRPLYNAMKKYGIEHFFIEEIEECSDLQLEEREKYWIEHYDSYHKGYNATLGGDGKILYDHELILKRIYEGKSTKEITDEFKCCVDIVYDLAKANNISMKIAANTKQFKEVFQFTKDNKFLKRFNSVVEAAQWCIDNKLSKGTAETVRKKISDCSNCTAGRKSAYGYVWKYKNEKL